MRNRTPRQPREDGAGHVVRIVIDVPELADALKPAENAARVLASRFGVDVGGTTVSPEGNPPEVHAVFCDRRIQSSHARCGKRAGHEGNCTPQARIPMTLGR
jgi:hypothetical protein